MAAGTSNQLIPGLVADTTSLAAKQFYIVQATSTAGGVKIGTSATSKCLGAVQNDPAVGEPAMVPMSGVALVISEDSVSYGDALKCSTTARAKSTTTGGDRIIGLALEAGDAGDIIRYLVAPGFMGD